MEHLKKVFLTSLLFFAVYMVNGQTTTVTGEVHDSNGVPIPGVEVTVKDTDVGIDTDFDGQYSIQIPEGSPGVLVFSAIGFVKQEIAVGDQDEVSVVLKTDIEGLDEVVVVGYGTQTKRDVSSAVASINPEVLESRPIADVGRGLQGASPGLTITTASGQIGENPLIRLRGAVGSLGTSGGSEPLILVDNVEVTSLQDINPEDIKDISVLKDAASTSIYGSRGAWGVILITTKGGKRNSAPTISYSNNFSWSTPTITPKIAPAAEGAEMAFKALRRTNPSTNEFGIVGMWIDQPAIERMRDWEAQYGDQDLGREMEEGRDFEIRDGKLFFYRPWDPRKLFVKKYAPLQKHDLSISGGSERTNYYLGLGYLKQDGIYKVNMDSYERFNLNLSLNSSITDWMDVHAKILNSNSVHKDPFIFGSATYGPWYYTTRWPATYPYGTLDGYPFRSALAEVEQANLNRDTRALNRINLGTTINPIEDMEINIDYTHDQINEHSKLFGGNVTGYDFWSTGPDLEAVPYQTTSFDKIEYISDWSKRNTGKAYLTYDKQLHEDHQLKVMLGGDLEEYEFWYHSSERRGLINPDMGEISLATGDQYVTGDRDHWATLGFFGRINYIFKDKFLLEFNSRYDGSSRLSPDKKWGFFPSGSLGYILTEEPFMEGLKPTLSFLKIRGSYGEVGNQNTALSNIYRLMGTSETSWLINGDPAVTVDTPGSLPVGLTWETVSTLDFGFDAKFFNDDLGINFDWYRRTVSDMHSAGRTLPSTFGTTSPQRNYGEMYTQGWELEVAYNHSFTNGLNLSVKASLTDFKEKISKFANETKGINTNYEGKVLGEIWGYDTDRYFTADDFDSDGNLKDGIPSQEVFETNGWFFYGPGDVKYKDLDGDGEIGYGSQTVDDHGDMKVIGNSTPRYQYGLTVAMDWKGFDLSVFMQGVGKRNLWPSGPVIVPGYSPSEAWFAHQLDYWTEDNPDAHYPRPTNQGQSNDAMNFLPQTKYLLDMSYFRMKNITFGYSLPHSVLDKLNLSRFRIYVSGENLFEHTNLDVPLDPEIDYTTAGLNDPNTFGREYPYRRSYSFGIQVSL